MAGVDLDAVAELDEPAQRVEETLGALARLDREVGPRGVADEERVAGEDDPRIGPAREVADREAAVLGPVPGRVDAAQDDVAERDLVAVLERVVRVLGLGGRMDAHRDAVLEREPPVPERWSACVCVSTTRTMRTSRRSASVEVLLDRERRIDDDRLSRFPDRRRGRTRTRARRRRTA